MIVSRMIRTMLRTPFDEILKQILLPIHYTRVSDI